MFLFDVFFKRKENLVSILNTLCLLLGVCVVGGERVYHTTSACWRGVLHGSGNFTLRNPCRTGGCVGTVSISLSGPCRVSGIGFWVRFRRTPEVNLWW